MKKSVLEDEFSWYTYQEVLNRVDDIAMGLKDNYKLVPNDKVQLLYFLVAYIVIFPI